MKNEKVKMFVRCGDRFTAPGEDFIVVTLPGSFAKENIKSSLLEIKKNFQNINECDLYLATPVVFGVAVGQAFEHLPIKINYFQLNQLTKQYELWVSNIENL